ncbi:MAG TPA: maleylpyruvate isomerase family mycothiol-dependent enzyme [Acidimicrobiales bacterium]|nr:maleylpyruvate isomerase family mycothiol-dependent enzyme [Acidimicrobiales bacterium]
MPEAKPDWAAVVEREGTALGDAAAGDLAAPVPAAPGWTAGELLRHVGLMQSRGTLVLRTFTMERPTVENGMLAEPPTEGVVEWYRAGLAALVAAVAALDDPDRPAYAFSPAHRRAGFWPRRMAHETTVHRVDGEQAAGRPAAPIDAALALDGIDEVLSVFVPALSAGRSPGDGRTVHLHATDADGEWLIRFDPDSVATERGHAKADAAVRGPAASLYLWLWGRCPLEDLEVFGDRSAVDALRVLTTF